MCTAYELGKQRGSTPGYLNPKAIAELLLVEETRLIRPTIPAPVIKADGTLATMIWGFRRAFAPKVKGKPPPCRASSTASPKPSPAASANSPNATPARCRSSPTKSNNSPPRWPTQSIRLNTDLAKKPPECLEYIVVHELMHLLEPTHNARFQSLMDQHHPKWRSHQQTLNRLPVRHESWGY